MPNFSMQRATHGRCRRDLESFEGQRVAGSDPQNEILGERFERLLVLFLHANLIVLLARSCDCSFSVLRMTSPLRLEGSWGSYLENQLNAWRAPVTHPPMA